jgi:hypothetical protein
LRSFVLLGKHLIPKSLIYALALSITDFTILYILNFTLEILLSLLPALLATCLFWYEAFDLIIYKRRLFRRRSNFRTKNSNV